MNRRRQTGKVSRSAQGQRTSMRRRVIRYSIRRHSEYNIARERNNNNTTRGVDNKCDRVDDDDKTLTRARKSICYRYVVVGNNASRSVPIKLYSSAASCTSVIIVRRDIVTFRVNQYRVVRCSLTRARTRRTDKNWIVVSSYRRDTRAWSIDEWCTICISAADEASNWHAFTKRRTKMRTLYTAFD